MKTVEMLAKYLHQWPDGYSRLVHIEGIFFGTPTDHNSTLLAMSNEELAGFPPAEDSGISVTKEEWSQEKIKPYKFYQGHGLVGDVAIPAGTIKPHSYDDRKGELLYDSKLQCLSAALLQFGVFSKSQAKEIAEAINTGFDAIN